MNSIIQSETVVWLKDWIFTKACTGSSMDKWQPSYTSGKLR